MGSQQLIAHQDGHSLRMCEATRLLYAPAPSTLPVGAVSIALPVALSFPLPTPVSVPVSVPPARIAGAVLTAPHGAVVPPPRLIPVPLTAASCRLPAVLAAAVARGVVLPVAIAARLVTVALGSAAVSTGPTGRPRGHVSSVLAQDTSCRALVCLMAAGLLKVLSNMPDKDSASGKHLQSVWLKRVGCNVST